MKLSKSVKTIKASNNGEGGGAKLERHLGGRLKQDLVVVVFLVERLMTKWDLNRMLQWKEKSGFLWDWIFVKS